MTHPLRGVKTGRNTSKSRKDRIYDYIKTNPTSRFTVGDIFNKFSFNSDTGTIRMILEQLETEGLIMSDGNNSQKVYYAKN